MNHKLILTITMTLLLSLVLAACSGADSPPAPEPEPAEDVEQGEAAESMGNEAPMLAERVAAGDLPPVEERLPTNPAVVEPLEEIGTYGGTLTYLHFWPGAETTKMLLNDPPIILTPDYSKIIPNLFANTGDYSADGLTLTWQLREGVRWSDGEPFTSADLMWWWDNMVNDERCEAAANPFFYVGGDPATGTPPQLMGLSAPDDYTLVMTLPAPNYLANTVWASGFWEFQEVNMIPSHYLEQFHPEFNDDIEDCEELLQVKNNWFFDPDYPVLGPWMTVEEVPGEKVVLERNPYYWKVDSAGNQLPYIDRVESLFVPDQQVRTLMTVNGEVDVSIRELDPRDRGLILDSLDQCDCRILNWNTGAASNPLMYINGNYVGDVEGMADLLRNAQFKRGLSHAINRDRILNTAWNGLGETTNSDTILASFVFDMGDADAAEAIWQEWSDAYKEYDVELADQMLDEAGLDQRDDEGYRTMPDGSPLEMNILVTDWEFEEVNAAAAALIAEDWDVVGVRSITTSATGDAFFNFAQNAEWQVFLSQSGAFGEWLFPSHIFEPLDGSKAFPLVGQWWNSGGESGQAPEPGGPEDRLIQIYQQTLQEPDRIARGQLLADAVRVHIDDGPFKLGLVGNQPALATARNSLRNVPDFGITAPWTPGAPGSAQPPLWYFNDN
ncbi:hypothetical protein KFU94_55160 [Chloroflexi bacterium TSY]|nr:hypothetical protein [Chloroflexi bacterium TSY]